MKFIERGFTKFSNARSESYKAAFIYLIISQGLVQILAQMEVLQSGLISTLISLFLIPLSYGLVKFFMRASLSEGNDTDISSLFSFYQEGGLKAIFTNICQGLVILVPIIVYVIAVVAVFINISDALTSIPELQVVGNSFTADNISEETIREIWSLFSKVLLPTLLLILVLIYLGIRMIFVILVVVDETNDDAYFKAITRSFAISKGNFWKIFSFGLGYVFLAIASGVVTFLLSLFVVALPLGDYLAILVSIAITAYVTCIYNYGLVTMYEELALKLPTEMDKLEQY